MVIDLQRLSDLIEPMDFLRIQGDINFIVRDIHYDSRRVVPGAIFVSIKGEKFDGHDFIVDAISKGALAVVTEAWQDMPSGVAQILVENTRVALAKLSARYFDNPSSKFKLVGITGTNGKTTTSYLVRSIFNSSGLPSGLIGTIEYIIGDKRTQALRTTPESYDLQRLFFKMHQSCLTHAVMEVSSHSIDLKRVVEADFDLCLFTNLTQDHLDFHGDMEAYYSVKRRLFEENPKALKAINIDDAYGLKLAAEFDNPITFALGREAKITADEIVTHRNGASFAISFGSEKLYVESKLNGLFNVYNSLASFACGYGLGIDPDNIKKGLESLESVPGRFERVDFGQNFDVYVDYAHTPDGLEKLIKNAKEIAKGKVILVFGCGGDRDRKKRPLMGRIAEDLADVVIITSDNPRSEEPGVIIDEILSGVERRSPSALIVEPDRQRAIQTAVNLAKEGDTVLIAGKGHESGQEIKGVTTPFSDTEVAKEMILEVLR